MFQSLLKCTLFLLLLCSPFWTVSQIVNFDVEAIAADSNRAEGELKGFVSMNITQIYQKSPVWNIANSLLLSTKVEEDLLIFKANSRLTVDGKRQIQNAGSANLRYLWKYREKWSPEVFSQFQWDAVRGMEERFVLGFNYRLRFVRSENTLLLGAVGLMGEAETWNFSGVSSSEVPVGAPKRVYTEQLKANVYLKFYQKINTMSSLEFAVYYQALPDQFFSRVRVAPIVNLNIGLTNQLMLSVSWAGIYDFSPVVPVDPLYYRWNNSLIFRF